MGSASGYALASGLFLRGLGVVYAMAFGSLAVQALGLYGSEGILPASEILAFLRERLGAAAALARPSLFWRGRTSGRCSSASRIVMAEKQEKESRLPARWDPFGDLFRGGSAAA